jgi:hypothetical protein
MYQECLLVLVYALIRYPGPSFDTWPQLTLLSPERRVVCIGGVTPGGAAAASGRIRVGDRLLQLNGHVIPTDVQLDAVPGY